MRFLIELRLHLNYLCAHTFSLKIKDTHLFTHNLATYRGDKLLLCETFVFVVGLCESGKFYNSVEVVSCD